MLQEEHGMPEGENNRVATKGDRRAFEDTLEVFSLNILQTD
jgi:hypothetical protein